MDELCFAGEDSEQIMNTLQDSEPAQGNTPPGIIASVPRSSKSQAVKMEPVKTEPVKTERVKTEPVKVPHVGQGGHGGPWWAMALTH